MSETNDTTPETPTEINDGGLAFPHEPYSADSRRWSDGSPGMTLRDYFAAKALAVVAPAAIDFDYADRNGSYHIALQAYQMADAMLTAREARK